MKNDCVRSSLIELQSFLQSKIDIDPIHRVLMSLPCFMHVLCRTWFIQVDCIEIPRIFVNGIHKQKDYCLSVCCSNADFSCINPELSIECNLITHPT